MYLSKRKEQIEEAAIDYQLGTKPMAIGGDMFAEEARRLNINPSFVKGAEWSDENPSEDNIAAYLGKKGWPLSTQGVPTFEEASEIIMEGCTHQKEQWMKKACVWLNNFYNDKTHAYLLNEDIEAFVKYMGEK
jgi:hypothetical protein